MPHTATLPLLLKQLKLTTMGRHWERLLEQAEQDDVVKRNRTPR